MTYMTYSPGWVSIRDLDDQTEEIRISSPIGKSELSGSLHPSAHRELRVNCLNFYQQALPAVNKMINCRMRGFKTNAKQLFEVCS